MADTHFAVLDEQKFSAFHWRTILVTGLGVFCDGYDISSIALVLTSVLATLEYTPSFVYWARSDSWKVCRVGEAGGPTCTAASGWGPG